MIEAMKQALEALEMTINYQDAVTCDNFAESSLHMPSGATANWYKVRASITSLRAAIEEAEKAEPVGEVRIGEFDALQIPLPHLNAGIQLPIGTKLYAHAPEVEALRAENARLSEWLLRAENYGAELLTNNQALTDERDELLATLPTQIEDAWRDGYRSLRTYNDVDISDEDTRWKESQVYAAIAKAEGK